MSASNCRCGIFHVVNDEEMQRMRKELDEDPILQPFTEDVMRSANAAMKLNLCISCYLGR